MTEEWIEQMGNFVNTLEKLEHYINVTDEEKKAIEFDSLIQHKNLCKLHKIH